MRIICIICYLLLALTSAVNAQYYTSGADPASLRWKKIETENFKVVFPQDYEEKAQHLVKLLEEVYKYGTYSLAHQPKKISVLVHPETTYSNGFVTWAPRRIELYPTPNQSMHAQEWLQQLAIHEFRHVVQIDKLNNGFTKILSYILGEQAVGAVLGLYVPMWFLEGDAVTTETALTQSGRGRSPWFEQGMRAQILEKGIYSYDKAYFGSYKDYVPNYYEMGYQLVAGARAKYGTDIWEQALYNTGRNSWAINAFNKGQKSVSGLNKIQLYYEIFAGLHNDWVKQDDKGAKTGYTALTSKDEDYSNYCYPVLTEDGKILAQLSGPGDVDQFVEVKDDGSHQALFVPGTRSDEPFSYANGIICWAERESDLRWDNRAYSVIKCYDIKSRKKKKVTHKSRYFSPALSPQGNQIAAVYADKKNTYALVILDRHSGEELQRYVYGNDDYLFTPCWNTEGDKIVCISLSESGKEIVILDRASGQWTSIMGPTYDDISLAKWGKDGEIYFTAGYGGTSEIYCIDEQSRQVRQLTQSKYGATGAVYDDEAAALIYSNYTADGYQLVKAGRDQLKDIPVEEVEDASVKLYEKIARQEEGELNFSNIDEVEDYSVKKYSKWNLFNFHSWAPAFVNINDESVNTGVSALSQNLLGTAVSSVGYNADPQYSDEKYYFNFQYQGWFPVFELDVKYGDEDVNYDGYYSSNSEIFSLYCDTKQYQSDIEAGFYLPLSLTRGKYYNYLKPAVDFNLYHLTGYDIEKENYESIQNVLIPTGESSVISVDDYTYASVEYSLYYYHLMRTSERDVTYRWGQLMQVLYQSTPFGTLDIGAISGLWARLYFPGLMKHHSLRIDNEYQYKWDGEEYESSEENDVEMNYRFGNYFDFARGYSNYSNDRLYSLKTDYIFPLWNPDFSVPGLMYLKRITTNLFFDYTKSWEDFTFKSSGQTITESNDYKSFGAEFRAEVNVLRFLFPLEVGYRYSRLIDLNQNSHEFLLSLSISGFSVGNK
jgi:WD40 repeat protein